MAVAAGHKPVQKKMEKPLVIQGVGNGVQQCEWEVTVPIAVPSSDGQHSVLHNFETPVVQDPGGDLPLILGLRSISEKEGVLETGPKSRQLSFPGPGGYSIQWSPGTRHFPLVPAPSGHLMMECDHYNNLVRPAGLATPTTTFYATGSASSDATAVVADNGAESSKGNGGTPSGAITSRPDRTSSAASEEAALFAQP